MNLVGHIQAENMKLEKQRQGGKTVEKRGEPNLPSRCRGSSRFRPHLDTLKAAEWRSWGRYASRSLTKDKTRRVFAHWWEKQNSG